MRTPAGTECRFFYEDNYRGRERQECRLLKANPHTEPWRPKLCFTCPVPGILRANSDPALALEGRFERRFIFWRRVAVSAYCTRHLKPIPDPHIGCAECRAERTGQSVFDLPVAPDEENKAGSP